MTAENVYGHLRQEIERAAARTTPNPKRTCDRFNTELDAGLVELKRVRYEIDRLLKLLASDQDGAAWTALTSFAAQSGASGTPAATLNSAYVHLARAHAFAQTVV